MRSNTLFTCVSYHPEEHQVLTAGTARKVGFWETLDATLIREVDASQSGAINALDISADGTYFVTGSDDKLVKVSRRIPGFDCKRKRATYHCCCFLGRARL